MFSERRIRLSELAKTLDLDIRTDAEIAYVGKIPTRLPHRLVPAGKREYLDEARNETGIAAYVVTNDLVELVPTGAGLIVSERPQVTAMQIHEHLTGLPDFLWDDFDSRIDPSAVVMPGAWISPKNVVIGPRSRIGPNAVLYERTIIGADVLIEACVVLGSEAFEFFPGAQPKRILKQAGGVIVEDMATIFPNSVVARATFGGFTRVGREAKIDALVSLAHDVQIGERATLISCSVVLGRVEVGDDGYLGPNCTISNGVKIGAGATVSLGSVVVRDVPSSMRVTGNFALPHDKWLNFIRTFR